MLSWPPDKAAELEIYIEACLKQERIIKIPKTIKLNDIEFLEYEVNKNEISKNFSSKVNIKTKR